MSVNFITNNTHCILFLLRLNSEYRSSPYTNIVSLYTKKITWLAIINNIKAC